MNSENMVISGWLDPEDVHRTPSPCFPTVLDESLQVVQGSLKLNVNAPSLSQLHMESEPKPGKGLRVTPIEEVVALEGTASAMRVITLHLFLPRA